jgi:hypothetical protein
LVFSEKHGGGFRVQGSGFRVQGSGLKIIPITLPSFSLYPVP